MKPNMVKFKEFAALTDHGSTHKMSDGNIAIEFFRPYTRSTWEFKVSGVEVGRRYSPRTATRFYLELFEAAHDEAPCTGCTVPGCPCGLIPANRMVVGR